MTQTFCNQNTSDFFQKWKVYFNSLKTLTERRTSWVFSWHEKSNNQLIRWVLGGKSLVELLDFKMTWARALDYLYGVGKLQILIAVAARDISLLLMFLWISQYEIRLVDSTFALRRWNASWAHEPFRKNKSLSPYTSYRMYQTSWNVIYS